MVNPSNPRPQDDAQSLMDQEVQQTNQLAKQTFELLQKHRSALPVELSDHLSVLSSHLMRLSQQAKKRKEEQNNLIALTEVSQVVNSSLDINEVLRIVMDTIVRLTGAERGFLMLKDEKGDFVTQTGRNWEQESIDSSEFAASRSVISRVVSDGQPVLTTNAIEDPRFGDKESIIVHNLRSIMCVPLKVKDELIGVIYADNRFRSGIFSESQLKLLDTFSNQAAIALDNARLFESVRRTLAEVTELKNLMDDVFASIASGVITADLANRIILCNRAAVSILGSLPEDPAGHHLEELLPVEALRDEGENLYQHIQRVSESGSQIVGVEIDPVLPRRGHVQLSLNLSPLKDATQTTHGVAIVVDDLTEKKRLEAQRRLFERMVSPAVISQLNPDQLQLGGKRTKITTLFADIRGFTHFSEQFEPEELVAVLNNYLAAAADAVLAQEGTVDKFLGDAVMAWYNAPIPQPDHALRAVKTAIGIRNAVIDLNSKLSPESQLTFGVGIHYGDAVLGLVGTEKRLDYTAIGDSVNTAKRIQENSNPGQIVISASVYKLVKDQVLTKSIEPIIAKGKSQPVEVYEVIDLK